MLAYKSRLSSSNNPTARKLFQIIETKQTNLSLSADVTSKIELIKLADEIGPHICMLKTHIDIIEDFEWDLVEQLKKLARKHQFVIFEDRKFADIGNTVKSQYEKGIYHIADWAPITNAHTLPGPGIIDGLKLVGLPKGNGLLLLAEMSSANSLFTKEYTQKTVALAQQNKDFVIGFISQHKLTDDPGLIHCTPGIQFASSKDNLGQQYITPEQAIKNGSDVIIVGRGIYGAANPVAEAIKYKEAGWQAYQRQLIHT